MRPFILAIFVLLGVTSSALVLYSIRDEAEVVQKVESAESKSMEAFDNAQKLGRVNPLKDKKFYVNSKSAAALRADTYKQNGNVDKARLIQEISEQPAAIWLIGPNSSDPNASRDTAEVERTSQEASATGTVPVYELYAIPNRDACAGYSSGGFVGNAEYIAWLDRILGVLKTPSVFSVEADAISQTVNSGCLSEAEKEERYKLINDVVQKLAASPNALAIYIDAGHPEWFPDPTALVEPLQKSGISHTDGVSVNVSNFVDTQVVAEWSQKLMQVLGENYGVVIDTSRNGRGATPTGPNTEARWCNPSGRGLGNIPTTTTGHAHVDAYLWIKAPGESDGSCSGYPSAGQFVDSIAFELAENSLE